MIENLKPTQYHYHGPKFGIANTLVHNFLGVRVNDVLSGSVSIVDLIRERPTLIMIAKVDRNNDGFAAGSRTFVEDWKLWKGGKRY